MTFASPPLPPLTPDATIGGERITWGPKDVLIGVGGYFVAFFVVPGFILTPFVIATGDSSRPTLIVALAVTVFSQLALVAVAAWRSFRTYGGGWEKLGFRRVRLSWSLRESACERCGRPPEPQSRFCIRCGAPFDASIHAISLARIVAWALAALVGAYVIALGYALIVEFADLGWLQSQCDDQIPKEVQDDKLLLALAGIGVVGLAPFCEEIFFRGFMFPGFIRKIGVALAIIASAALFSGAHLQYKAFVPILGVGLAFAFAYWRSGTIYTTMLAHLAFNIIAYTALVTTNCDPDAGSVLLPVWR